MNYSKDSKSKPQLDPMPQLLFPVRTFNGEESETAALSQGDNGNRENKSVSWVGMNPLEMIESLAAATEQRESLQWGYTTPLVVDQVQLSSKQPVPLTPKAHTRKASATFDFNVSKREVEDSHKRRRLLDGLVSTQEVQPRFLGPWDLSFIQERDVDTAALAGRILFLGRTLESISTFQDVALSYGRVRDHFAGSYYGIQHHYSQPVYGNYATHQAFEKKVQLERLFHETSRKLEEIIDMARNRESYKAFAAQAETSHFVSDPPPQPFPMVQSAKPQKKGELKEYMTNWLRDNWTNPYPDEALLESMARDCGESPKIVNNWLINNRVRKWRKAIEEAMALKRPASLLLEDSINIFDKKKLRPLPPGTTMSSPTVHKNDYPGNGH